MSRWEDPSSGGGLPGAGPSERRRVGAQLENARLLSGELLLGQGSLFLQGGQILELLDAALPAGAGRLRGGVLLRLLLGARVLRGPSVRLGDGSRGSRRRSRCRRGGGACNAAKQSWHGFVLSRDAASAASRASIRSWAGMRSNATGTPPLRRTAATNGAAQQFLVHDHDRRAPGLNRLGGGRDVLFAEQTGEAPRRP